MNINAADKLFGPSLDHLNLLSTASLTITAKWLHTVTQSSSTGAPVIE